MKAFKAYDIRGVYGRDFHRETVYRIGFFLPSLLKTSRVLVGWDCRETSPEILSALTEGITDSGADVYRMGFSTTPMVYFATAVLKFDASVQITASHNPREYNGLKISRGRALPVGYDQGLEELERMISEESVNPSVLKGKVVDLKNVRRDYIAFLREFSRDISNLRFGIDCSNGMASILVHQIFGRDPEYIYDTMDGSFPNHPPNPLDEANTTDLKELVLEKGLDIGVIFDGDGDRVMFVDETGRFVRPDIIIAVLAQQFLAEKGERVLHDIRTSRGVIRYIERAGGRPCMWKVGHSHAKMKMREIGAVYGGELAGHYYFRDFFNCDSGMLAAIMVLNAAADLKRKGQAFSSLVDEIDTLCNSGEINFRISDKIGAMEALRERFTELETPEALYDFDGYRIEFPGWWFNVRPSNTEPYLRLVVEAENRELLESKLKEIRAVIEKKGGG